MCALKKMRKGTLAKMDEVKHVLVERDILTAVKTPWLVRLLYAFQDTEHVYLAMVSYREPDCLRKSIADDNRSTFQAETLGRSSTTLAFSRKNTPAFTRRKSSWA